MSGHNGASELAKLIFCHPQPEQKQALKQILLEKYPQETLVNLLEHKIEPMRRAATYGLGLIGDTKAVPPLLEALKHYDPKTRSNAEEALWAIWFRSGDETIDGMLQKGMKHIENKQYQEAIEILTQVIQTAPDFPEGHNQRAIAYFLTEQWRLSIEDCQQAVELNSDHFGAYAGMGHCYLKLGELREAMDAYQKALEINPNLYSIAHTILSIQIALRRHLEDE